MATQQRINNINKRKKLCLALFYPLSHTPSEITFDFKLMFSLANNIRAVPACIIHLNVAC